MALVNAGSPTVDIPKAALRLTWLLLLLPWRCCRRKGGKRKGTGVKYDDVAGIDHIKSDVKEVRFGAKRGNQTQQAAGRLGPAVVLS